MHCFSMPERLEHCLAAGWWISFAGNVTYPANAALADAAAAVPPERLLVETDAPYLAPAPRRGERNEPAYVRRDSRVRRAAPRDRATPSWSDRRAQRRFGIRLVSAERANRRCGGCRSSAFDRATHSARTSLSTRTSLASSPGPPSSSPTDVVLEIGGGVGVLSEYLAPRVAHLHVVEIDRDLEPALRRRARALRGQRHAALCRRDGARARDARPAADEGRREPPLRHRRRRDPADCRGAAARRALAGDGPARGRGALRRRRPARAPTACQASSPSSPAR